MAVTLALAASLAYGLSNFVGPLLSREAPTYVILIAGQAIALLTSAVIVAATHDALPGGAVVAAALVAGLGNAAGVAAFYRAAELGPLSIVAPIGATATIIPVAAGIAEGEPAGPLKLLGVVLAVAGVALASRRPEPTRAAPAQGADPRKAVAWSLVAAGGFGVFLTFIAPASGDGIFWAVAVSRISLLLALVAVAGVLGAALRAPGRELPKLAIPGLLLFGGTVAYSAATRAGDLSVVSVIGSLFPLVTVGLAFALLGERLSRLQAVGVACALIGVVLLSLR